jgi:uncharacterized membrane protein
MPAGDVAPTLITFLHDLFTVVWVGGMLTLALVVLPVARTALGPGPQVQRLMGAIHARLRWFVYASIAGLAVTGVMLAQRSDAFGGFFTWGDGYGVALSLKHAVVILMAVVAITRSVLLTRQAAAGPAQSSPAAGTGPASPAAGPAQSRPAGPGRPSPAPSRSARVATALLGVNVALALGVLVLSSWTAVAA